MWSEVKWSEGGRMHDSEANTCRTLKLNCQRRTCSLNSYADGFFPSFPLVSHKKKHNCSTINILWWYGNVQFEFIKRQTTRWWWLMMRTMRKRHEENLFADADCSLYVSVFAVFVCCRRRYLTKVITAHNGCERDNKNNTNEGEASQKTCFHPRLVESGQKGMRF